VNADGSVGPVEFAALMAPLGPFEPAPRLAAAVSGGADSLALALLADSWARERGGSLLTLIVDHGLRPEAEQEARDTAARLAGRGIATRILTVEGLSHGTGLAERAREARYGILLEACREQGILHLLLGHHAADQAETVIMRSLSSSGLGGLASMARLAETRWVRVLRPLLAVPPARLRATVAAAGLDWVSDPSNSDPAALRPRLRALRADRDGTGAATAALVDAAAANGRTRAAGDTEGAHALAEVAAFRPEGFAYVAAEAVPAPVLAAIIQAISGAAFPPPSASVARLAAALRPATLAGVRLMPGGRLGPGFLLVREEAAMAPPVLAAAGAVWDRRFRLGETARPPPAAGIGPLGTDAARLRDLSALPAAVLRTLPALRSGDRLFAVPNLNYPNAGTCADLPILFCPARPASPAPYFTG